MAKGSSMLRRNRSITGKVFTKPSIKPQHTRKIIRRYHLLINKKDVIYRKLSTIHNTVINDENISQFNKASRATIPPSEQELLSVANETSVVKLYEILRKIEYETVENGGLAKYQIASLDGQETKRGSDSSKWLFDNVPELKEHKGQLTALEIGCLSTKNVIRKYAKTTGIDLNSNEPGILKQDFMERPIPKDNSDKFNLISCSLVLNFVPTPEGRGAMLRRFQEFLHKDDSISMVFFVLPLSCITNSRYMDKDHFIKICKALGFSVTHYHEANKLVYMVLKWNGQTSKRKFAKTKLHDGPSMNNFSIVL